MRDTFKQIPVRVFDKLGSVILSGTYRKLESNEYQPGGKTFKVYADSSIRFLKGPRSVAATSTPTQLKRGSETSKLTQYLISIASIELGFQPSTEDLIVYSNETYQIVSWSADPAEALYEISVIRQSECLGQ